MNKRSSRRITLLTYFALLAALVTIVAVAARDVLFERFTYRIGATVVGGTDVAYAIGGRSTEGNEYLQVLVLDPAARTIGVRRGLQTEIHGLAAASIGSGVMIMGGTTARGYSNEIRLFDRATGKITQRTELPHPVAYAASAVAGNTIYVVGGYDGESRRREIVAVDPDTNTARVTALLPKPRDQSSAAAYGDSLFVISGEGPGGERLSDILELDPTDGTVLRRLDLPQPLVRHSATVDGNRLVILGVDYGNRNVIITLDLSVPANTQLIVRRIDLDARSCVIVNVAGELLAVGSAHPQVSRQIGIWSVDSASGAVEARRYHSRIWQ